jgi:hypothetical protein
LVPSKAELREERMQIEITLLRTEKKDLVKQRDDLVQDNLAMVSEIERLRQAIKQGQREILLKAADLCDTFASKRCGHSDEIRRMADEIK